MSRGVEWRDRDAGKVAISPRRRHAVGSGWFVERVDRYDHGELADLMEYR